MDIIKQVVAFPDIGSLVLGLLFFICGILVAVFKQYWLIAGVNTASKKELAKIDMDYVGKYFGISIGILGLVLFFSPFLFRFLNIMKYFPIFLLIIIIGFGAFMFIYGQAKKDRIYKKK